MKTSVRLLSYSKPCSQMIKKQTFNLNLSSKTLGKIEKTTHKKSNLQLKSYLKFLDHYH